MDRFCRKVSRDALLLVGRVQMVSEEVLVFFQEALQSTLCLSCIGREAMGAQFHTVWSSTTNKELCFVGFGVAGGLAPPYSASLEIGHELVCRCFAIRAICD